MVRVLSTKKLTPSQRELLLNAGLNVVEQDFIKTVPVPFKVGRLPEHLIFTSANAVRVVLEKLGPEALSGKNIYCVGEKTAGLLMDQGYKIKEVASYGTELAGKIVEKHSEGEFLFFCGRIRRPELPKILRTEGVHLTEVIVYDTLPTPKKTGQFFQGVLFFSPSAVESYFSCNELKDGVAFCIGTTTAEEARKHTSTIVTAKKPSVENVIVQVVKNFKLA